ncbi:hypothetical protein VTK73DRAFT_8739 [Phialemonium thermophilum]|uniref:Uncharacterized protein n=1 Tax=Phialemonium thermophilum TaxID=223376 RepID=A0ABR3W6I8_9PEZI
MSYGPQGRRSDRDREGTKSEISTCWHVEEGLARRTCSVVSCIALLSTRVEALEKERRLHYGAVMQRCLHRRARHGEGFRSDGRSSRGAEPSVENPHFTRTKATHRTGWLAMQVTSRGMGQATRFIGGCQPLHIVIKKIVVMSETPNVCRCIQDVMVMKNSKKRRPKWGSISDPFGCGDRSTTGEPCPAVQAAPQATAVIASGIQKRVRCMWMGEGFFFFFLFIFFLKNNKQDNQGLSQNLSLLRKILRVALVKYIQSTVSVPDQVPVEGRLRCPPLSLRGASKSGRRGGMSTHAAANPDWAGQASIGKQAYAAPQREIGDQGFTGRVRAMEHCTTSTLPA